MADEKLRYAMVREALEQEARGTAMCVHCGAEFSQGDEHFSGCPVWIFDAMTEALYYAGKHLEDCCRTDIDWEEAMASHNDAVNALHDVEKNLSATSFQESKGDS